MYRSEVASVFRGSGGGAIGLRRSAPPADGLSVCALVNRKSWRERYLAHALDEGYSGEWPGADAGTTLLFMHKLNAQEAVVVLASTWRQIIP
jgi:hypothetical protein